jgi:putative oxidoreductase
MDHTAPGTKSLRFVLWITQILLAILFGMSGWMKSLYPLDQLVMYVPWSADVPAALVRFIGIAEALGAVGLILPAATRMKPELTPLAAAFLGLTMVFAIGFHLARGETASVTMPLVLGLLAAFVAWGRWIKAPIVSR